MPGRVGIRTSRPTRPGRTASTGACSSSVTRTSVRHAGSRRPDRPWQARPVPELPEVESLAAYLRRTATGLRVARIELAAISALKTFDPPATDLVGARV